MAKYPARFANRRAELGEIHRRAELLGMDTKDENESSEYRSMLWAVARVRSAAGLDWQGRRTVLDHLAALMKARDIPVKKPNEWAFIDKAAPDRQPLLRKICAVCIDMKVGKAYAEGAARRQHGIDRKLEMMNVAELHALAGALARTRQSKQEQGK